MIEWRERHEILVADALESVVEVYYCRHTCRV